jgi:nucleotide-binding universal stress UspA family protein
MEEGVESTKRFRVVWEIDLEEECALDAAEHARAIQVRPGTTATVFTVIDPAGDRVDIDLDDLTDDR